MPRPPKPRHLKALHGTDRPARLRTHAKFQPGAPNCPTWLGREAKAEWKRVVPELDAVGLLTEIDRGLVVLWCETWETYVDAYRILKEQGRTFTTEKGYVVQHPEVSVMHTARAQLRHLGPALGMGSIGRAKVEPVDVQASNPNKWDAP